MVKTFGELIIVSHNAFKELSPLEVAVDLVRLLKGRPDVVGVNEAANHVGTIREIATARGYRVIVPAEGGHAMRNDLLLVNTRTMKVHKWGARLEAAKTNGTPDRYQVWADLEHKATGVDLRAHVDHANSHIERPSWRHLARWHSGARPHFRKMRNQARRLDRPGVWIGDMNVNYRRRAVRRTKLFPIMQFRSVGVKSSYDVLGMPKRGTHGSRLIDYVFLLPKGRLKFERHSVGEGYNSDHRPLFVHLRIRPRTR